MAKLSWNEIRHNAHAFAKSWPDAKRESADKQTFWNEFFEVFGLKRRLIATFEEPVKKLSGHYGFIDLFWPRTLIVEHKSRGESLDAANSQAFDYIRSLHRENRGDEAPRYVLVSDFARLRLYDLEPDDQRDLPLFDRLGRIVTVADFPLDKLYEHIHAFAFIPGYQQHRYTEQAPINIKAVGIMARLHDTLEAGGYSGHDLERFLVRVLFCLFAEDTGIFERDAFRLFIENRTAIDGSDFGDRLARLFDVLNTEPSRRQRNLDEELAAFPYVNGALFADRLGFADFNREMRDAVLACTRFDWSGISPAVFGSLFQGVMEPKARRQIGGHYTSERDILKVVRSLFLDEMRADFDAARADKSTRRRARLEEFHERLARLRFLDPACGCGNFLILTYRELRLLELDVLKELLEGQREFTLDEVNRLSRVNVDQFHGIEIGEWPTRIAEVALWLMDHQMNLRVSEAFGQLYQRLPLRATPHIVIGNALEIDWDAILPRTECSYVLGNPPFVGKHLMTKSQEDDMSRVWGKTIGSGSLDYVSGWYRKAAIYIEGTHITVAFVSTNSITQGEQVGVLWNDLFQRWHAKIHFAHRTFVWISEARGKAHVDVVIIGFGAFDTEMKCIYDYSSETDTPTVSEARNISPYLIEGNDFALPSRRTPISSAPACIYGSKPVDGGHLIVEEIDRANFVTANPEAIPLLRPLLCDKEYLYGIPRWCLWLLDVSPARFRHIQGVMERIEGVRSFRSASKKEPTRKKAVVPSLFAEIRQPSADFIVIPLHTSENRRYIPWGYFTSEHIIHNSCSAIPEATAYHFGIISSLIHIAWVRTVCGRIRSDFRYSTNIVYNNYPWPDPTDAQRARVEEKARAVLDTRVPHLPPNGSSTLADLYDPLTMPAELAKAHADLDRAVERCYRREPFDSDRQRVEHLFALYEKLTAPLLPTTKRPGKRRT